MAGAEEQQYDFENVFESIKHRKLIVLNTWVEGLQRTRKEIVARELLAVQDAQSLDEIKDALLAAHENLHDYGIFEAVDVVADESSTGSPSGCDVTASFKEKRVLGGKIGVYTSPGAGSASPAACEATLLIRNALGFAETIDLTAAVGSGLSQSNSLLTGEETFSLGVSRVRPAGRAMRGALSLQQESLKQHRFSSYRELLRGLRFSLASLDRQHEVAYDLAWRQLGGLSPHASEAVLAQAGNSLKSALSYTFQAASIDDALYPTRGAAFRAVSEVAGLGLDRNLLRFLKQSLTWERFFCLWRFQAPAVSLAELGAAPRGAPVPVVLALRAQLGGLTPWGSGEGSRGETSISDRFFMGGVAGNLRGFELKGAGPSAERGLAEDSRNLERRRDALGADLSVTLGADLRFPVPLEPLAKAGVHGHCFVNGGSGVLLAREGRVLRDSLRDLGQSFRCSVGAGLVWPTALGCLELNACHVLRKGPHDLTCGRFQFGFASSSFLT